MIHLHGEAAGREINPRSGKYNPLPEDDIIEGALCIERNQGLEEFCRRANEAINILEEKIIRSLGP